MSTISMSCPGCQVPLDVPAEFAGKRGKCQACGTRFLIVPILERQSEGACLSDTVVNWLSDSVAGAPATTTQKHSGPDAPAPATPISIADNKHFALRLERVDPLGATLTFDPQIMYDLDFRACLPQQCITCGYQHNLTVHHIFWASKQEKPPRGKKLEPLPEPASLEMHYNSRKGRDLLNVLDDFKNMPKPFSLPFPYYVCNLCSANGALLSDVRISPATGKEQCLLTVVSLPQAEAILRNACGQECPDIQRIRAVRKADRNEPWRALPLTVRIRLNQWFEPHQGEQFLAYIPDSEVSRDDMGRGGIVLTGRRIVFQKDDVRLQAPLADPQSIRIDMGAQQANVHVRFPNGTAIHLAASLRCAARLQRLLDRAQESIASRKEAS